MKKEGRMKQEVRRKEEERKKKGRRRGGSNSIFVHSFSVHLAKI